MFIFFIFLNNNIFLAYISDSSIGFELPLKELAGVVAAEAYPRFLYPSL